MGRTVTALQSSVERGLTRTAGKHKQTQGLGETAVLRDRQGGTEVHRPRRGRHAPASLRRRLLCAVCLRRSGNCYEPSVLLHSRSVQRSPSTHLTLSILIRLEVLGTPTLAHTVYSHILTSFCILHSVCALGTATQESPDAFETSYDTAKKRNPQSWVQQADAAATSHMRCTFVAVDEHGVAVGLASLYRDMPPAGDHCE